MHNKILFCCNGIFNKNLFWDGWMGVGQLDRFNDSRGGWIGRTSTPLWVIRLAVLLYPEQKGEGLRLSRQPKTWQAARGREQEGRVEELFPVTWSKTIQVKVLKKLLSKKKSKASFDRPATSPTVGEQFCKCNSALWRLYFHKGSFVHSLAWLKLRNSTTTWTKSKQQHSSPKILTCTYSALAVK